MWIFWLVFSIIMFVGEVLSVSFFMIWFSIGGIAAAFTSFLTNNVYIQAVVMLVISTILVLATKPFTKKFLESKSKVESNVNALIGKKARVIQEINNIENTGKVKVNGEIWKAITENSEEIIHIDCDVTILAVDGVKLIVKL